MDDKFFKPAARRVAQRLKALVMPRQDYVSLQGLPITKARQSLIAALRSGTVKEELPGLWEEISNLDPKTTTAVSAIRAAVPETIDAAKVDLGSPVLQLAWAAKLLEATAGESPAEMLQNPFFKAIARSDGAQRELERFATDLVNNPAIDESATLDWGGTGSWFWYAPDLRHVNLDLFHSLAVGFEHNRAVALHEIGHAEISNAFTPEMTAFATRQKELVTKAQNEPLSPDEYTELGKVSSALAKRSRFYNAVEDVRDNALVTQQSSYSTQDYGYSLNAMQTLLNAPKPLPDGVTLPLGDPNNTANAANTVFFAHNGLFIDSPENYRQFGVDALAVAKNAADGHIQPNGFEELHNYMVGPGSISEMIPSPQLRYMPALYKQEVARLEVQSGQLIDELYHKFIIEKAPDPSATPDSQNPGDGQQSSEQKGSGSPQENKEGSPNEAGSPSEDGTPESGGEPKPPSKEGSSGESGAPSEKKSQEPADKSGTPPQDGSPSESGSPSEEGKPGSSDEASPPSGEGGESQSQGGGGQSQDGPPPEGGSGQTEGGKNSQDQTHPPQAGDPGEAGKQSGSDGEDQTDPNADPIEVRGEGQKPGFAPAPQTPEEARQQKRQPYAIKPADAKTIKEEAKKAAESGNSHAHDKLVEAAATLLGAGGEGGGYGGTFTNLRPPTPEGSRSAYLDIVEEERAMIKGATELFVDIQEQMKLKNKDRSRERQIVPEDGDMSRLDLDSFIQRKIKSASGKKLELDDFEHFRDDAKEKIDIPTADVVIAIDWSGSMSGWPIDAAVRLGAGLYESGKKAGMNVYVVMMGEPEPLLVAKPGDRHTDIGANIEGIKANLGGCRDQVGPATELVLGLIAESKGTQGGYAGNTHIIVVSDGQFNDEATSIPKIRALMKNSTNVTFDCLLIGNCEVKITELTKEINECIPSMPMSCTRVTCSAELGEKMLECLKNRLEKTELDKAVPSRKKNQMLRSALRKMEQF